MHLTSPLIIADVNSVNDDDNVPVNVSCLTLKKTDNKVLRSSYWWTTYPCDRVQLYCTFACDLLCSCELVYKYA